MELLVMPPVPDRRMTEVTDQPTPDEVFAVLTRELRTPLSTIEGYIELLNNGDVGALTAEQREYLDVVNRNVLRLISVVTDWADVCRLEADREKIARVDVDLEEIVDRAVAEVRPRIRVKEQRLRVELPDEPVVALGDARALLRVVNNLVSNAHKYTQKSGSIRIVADFEGDSMVRLDVVDTGIGLREEDQARLFHKFFRSSLTVAEPGSGLGLTLCSMLVERMGGTISVSSSLGQGSTFSVHLPRGGRTAPMTSPVMPESSASPASPATPEPAPVGACSEG
jgi:signal transduction histidine kinase